MKLIKLFLLAFLFILNSCSKGVDTPIVPPPIAESPVIFLVDIDPGASGILGVIGTSQLINVKISSTIPSAGLIVDLKVTKDLDNSSVFIDSKSSVSEDINFNITGLKPGVLCTANVVVTSKSTTTNNKTISFKLAAK